MRIGIIGLRNHAARMTRLAAGRHKVTELVGYHPKADRIEALEPPDYGKPLRYTTDFAALTDCDGVIIASPHPTHLGYIERLKDTKVRILCEKPPVSTEEQIRTLEALDDSVKARLDFNFNYAQTAFATAAQTALREGKLGHPLMASFTATHGLAFKEKFQKNWRLTQDDPFSNLLGNLGIHYIHMVLLLFGSISGWHMTRAMRAPASKTADTIVVMFDTALDVPVHLRLSYAAPYVNHADLILTDGMVVLDDGVVSIKSPRDSFDKNGRFCSPPERLVSRSSSSKEYYDQSIVNILEAFIDRIENKNDVTSLAAFERGLTATRLVLEIDRSDSAR